MNHHVFIVASERFSWIFKCPAKNLQHCDNIYSLTFNKTEAWVCLLVNYKGRVSESDTHTLLHYSTRCGLFWVHTNGNTVMFLFFLSLIHFSQRCSQVDRQALKSIRQTSLFCHCITYLSGLSQSLPNQVIGHSKKPQHTTELVVGGGLTDLFHQSIL